jgi:putative ABC transport system permease protein
MLKDYILLAIGNLRRRGLRSWLTMLGIFIGIAAVVALISLGQGLQTAITGQFSTLGTDKLTMTNAETGFGPPGSTAVKKLNQQDIDIIKSVSGVEEVIPRLIRSISIEYNKITGYSFAASMPMNKKQVGLIYETINLEAESGSLLKLEDKGKVVVGHDFTKIKTYEKDFYVGSKIKIKEDSYEVKGILKPASTFQLNSVILMNEEEMKETLGIEDEYDIIVIKVANGFDTEKVAEDVRTTIRKDRSQKIGKEDFSVQTPLQAISSVNTVLNIINLIIAGIAGISLFVGGVGIANTMYTSVLERRKEIGVMKAIGAKNRDVLWIFLIESALLGLAGGIIGAIIGLSLAFGISAAANSALGTTLLKVQISWPLLAGALAFSLIIGIVSGVLPARQASKLKPVDALRG